MSKYESPLKIIIVSDFIISNAFLIAPAVNLGTSYIVFVKRKK